MMVTGKPLTTVQDCVSASVSVKPLDDTFREVLFLPQNNQIRSSIFIRQTEPKEMLMLQLKEM